ncbi:MAG: sigma-54-dependent transcriptional regulator [Planctomycetota bacterium]|jgi:DNA-binding NtrC family response regulator
MSRILVVDDKDMMRDSVGTTLSRRGHTVIGAAAGTQALEKLRSRSIDAVVTDLQMPGMSGLELLGEIRKLDEQLPVIFMTAYGTIETAVAAMKQGAFDYITKPFSGDELLLAVERALEHGRLLRENQILRVSGGSDRPSRQDGARPMVGDGPVMRQLKDRLTRIADSHGTVLINGPSGSGKEVAARYIHERSPRAAMPMLALNCAALSTNLLESELFGHEKGAFTGADRLRKGRFELADGGTLLLDEISEIAPEIQAKLLRVLQERAFERVGSSTSRIVDVRVIATTNRDLPSEVARGNFRQDLFYRLNVLPVRMPGLGEHLEDLPDLVTHFLDEVARREGTAPKRPEPAALELMMSYGWPGNVRELQNISERAAVLTPDTTIRAGLIAPWLGAHLVDVATPPPPRKPDAMIEVAPLPGEPDPAIPRIVCDGTLTLEEVERETIVATLQHNNGHRQKSAKALGIGVRTLGLKLKKWKDQQLVSPTL